MRDPHCWRKKDRVGALFSNHPIGHSLPRGHLDLRIFCHSPSLSYIVVLTLGVSLGSPVKQVLPQGEFSYSFIRKVRRSCKQEYLHPQIRIGILNYECNGERNSLSRRGIGSPSFPKRLGNKITPVEVLGLARCTLFPSDHLVSTNPKTKCYLKVVHAGALTRCSSSQIMSLKAILRPLPQGFHLVIR